MKLDKSWERFYDKAAPQNAAITRRFKWFLEHLVGQRVLDVGCAGGLGVSLAAYAGYKVWGIDSNDVIIAMAKERLKNSSANISQQNAESMSFDDCFFDCVMCGETLEHVGNDENVLREICRVLKPQGILLVSVPDEGRLSKEHVRIYSQKTLRVKIVQAGFAILEESTMPAHRGNYLIVESVKL